VTREARPFVAAGGVLRARRRDVAVTHTRGSDTLSGIVSGSYGEVKRFVRGKEERGMGGGERTIREDAGVKGEVEWAFFENDTAREWDEEKKRKGAY
jgi:hypothetical protein